MAWKLREKLRVSPRVGAPLFIATPSAGGLISKATPLR
jgi:hypothetical protein